MPRYKLTVEYDGTNFVGWQRQANGLAIQQVIEEAVARLAGEAARVHGAGRTDAGVHARGQVAHVDLAREWPCETVRDALNAHLAPHPVAILAAERVAADFDARFSARGRHYLYRICNRRAPLALERGFAWHVRRRLDAGAMHRAAQILVGRHDFSTFRDANCQANSPIRTLDELTVTAVGEMIAIRACALSFLHRQVRSIVGSLERVGCGKWSAAELAAALEARDRRRCGPVAPPCGLYLMRVEY